MVDERRQPHRLPARRRSRRRGAAHLPVDRAGGAGFCRTPCPTRSCGSSTPSGGCSPRWRRPTRVSAGPSATASSSRWSTPNCSPGLDRFDHVEVRVEPTGWRTAPRPTTASPSSSRTATSRSRARYVVGCDGGRSATRRLMGVSFDGTTSSTRWLVIDCANDPLGHPNSEVGADPARPYVVDLDRARNSALRVHDSRRRVR